ncbi:MAG: hypothetical protein DRO99_00665 [Candidatus Aenigmatarchaeota archaeon]|nr:MAG: hypothetical protein DRO99_00665 [Candidatus Aenigmarchaeota archaeon]
MRGISIVSGVIFLAISITAVFLIYQTGMPVVKKMQAATAIERMKGVFSDLDEIVQQVASEGKGSKRTLYMKVDPGKVIVNSTEDSIYWVLETDAEVISPRTSQKLGNLVIGSNMETRAFEANYTFSDPEIPCYVLENEHLKAYLKRIGSPSSQQNYETKDILVAIYNKDMKQWLNNSGLLDISVDFNSTSKSGTGYTMLSDSGYNLPYATVSAYINSTHIEYYVNFTLESGADFMQIEASL